MCNNELLRENVTAMLKLVQKIDPSPRGDRLLKVLFFSTTSILTSKLPLITIIFYCLTFGLAGNQAVSEKRRKL